MSNNNIKRSIILIACPAILLSGLFFSIAFASLPSFDGASEHRLCTILTSVDRFWTRRARAACDCALAISCVHCLINLLCRKCGIETRLEEYILHILSPLNSLQFVRINGNAGTHIGKNHNHLAIWIHVCHESIFIVCVPAHSRCTARACPAWHTQSPRVAQREYRMRVSWIAVTTRCEMSLLTSMPRARAHHLRSTWHHQLLTTYNYFLSFGCSFNSLDLNGSSQSSQRVCACLSSTPTLPSSSSTSWTPRTPTHPTHNAQPLDSRIDSIFHSCIIIIFVENHFKFVLSTLRRIAACGARTLASIAFEIVFKWKWAEKTNARTR